MNNVIASYINNKKIIGPRGPIKLVLRSYHHSTFVVYSGHIITRLILGIDGSDCLVCRDGQTIETLNMNDPNFLDKLVITLTSNV